jgi:hypothetical protein
LFNGSFCKQRYKVPVACFLGSLFHVCHVSLDSHQGSNLHSLVSRLAPLLCIASLPSSSLSSLDAIAKYPNVSVDDRRMKQRLELEGLKLVCSIMRQSSTATSISRRVDDKMFVFSQRRDDVVITLQAHVQFPIRGWVTAEKWVDFEMASPEALLQKRSHAAAVASGRSAKCQ